MKTHLNKEQAGAELGQAQLKLGLICTNIINKKDLARTLVSFCLLSRPTWLLRLLNLT